MWVMIFWGEKKVLKKFGLKKVVKYVCVLGVGNKCVNFSCKKFC